jgi:hypothetical protein
MKQTDFEIIRFFPDRDFPGKVLRLWDSGTLFCPLNKAVTRPEFLYIRLFKYHMNKKSCVLTDSYA